MTRCSAVAERGVRAKPQNVVGGLDSGLRLDMRSTTILFLNVLCGIQLVSHCVYMYIILLPTHKHILYKISTYIYRTTKVGGGCGGGGGN